MLNKWKTEKDVIETFALEPYEERDYHFTLRAWVRSGLFFIESMLIPNFGDYLKTVIELHRELDFSGEHESPHFSSKIGKTRAPRLPPSRSDSFVAFFSSLYLKAAKQMGTIITKIVIKSRYRDR